MDPRIASGEFKPRVPSGALAWRDQPVADRSALRTVLRQARQTLSAAQQRLDDQARQALLGAALQSLASRLHQPLCVTGFMSVNGEPDLRCLREQLQDFDWWLPCTTLRGEALRWGPWPLQPPDLCPQAWRTGAYGIAEPVEHGLPTPHVVLVPLLGFSPSGHRLGYGAGYYDRTLAAWRAQGLDPLTIGVAGSGAACSDAVLAPLPTDEPLHAIVCELGWWIPAA
jgi:5,10-methenyltetrahydrofolate synthetase